MLSPTLLPKVAACKAIAGSLLLPQASTWSAVQNGQRTEEPVKLGSSISPRRLARPRTSPFHGGNTGSNPVGDANKLNHLLESGLFAEGLKGFDKKKSLPSPLLFLCLVAGHENHFDKLRLRCALHRSDGLCIGVGGHFVVRMA